MFKFNIENSLYLLNVYFIIGEFLGIYPRWTNKKFMILYPLLSVIAFFISGFSLFLFLKEYHYMPPVIKILSYTSYGLYFCSNFFFLYQMLKNKQSWIILFKCLASIKNKIGGTRANNKIIIINLSCLLLFTLPGLYTIFSIEDARKIAVIPVICTIQWILFVFQLITTIFSIQELATIIVETTNFVQQEIKLVFSNGQENTFCKCNRIDDVMFLYKNINILAHQFNKIFGMLMLIFLVRSFVDTLNVTCIIMRIIMTNTEYKYFFYVYLPMAGLLHVSTYCVNYFFCELSPELYYFNLNFFLI